MVTEWFCPGTMTNLKHNPRVSLVMWDAAKDAGYQLIGEAEAVEDLLMLDGYDPKMKDESRVPQVEWQVVIRVDKVIDFTRAPHTDTEE